MEVLGARVRRNEELVFNGYRVLVGKDEKGLEMDGCTKMCMSLMLL
jgi:hypothetical protein